MTFESIKSPTRNTAFLVKPVHCSFLVVPVDRKKNVISSEPKTKMNANVRIVYAYILRQLQFRRPNYFTPVRLVQMCVDFFSYIFYLYIYSRYKCTCCAARCRGVAIKWRAFVLNSGTVVILLRCHETGFTVKFISLNARPSSLIQWYGGWTFCCANF